MFSTVELPGQALSYRMEQVGPYLWQFFFRAVINASLQTALDTRSEQSPRNRASTRIYEGVNLWVNSFNGFGGVLAQFVDSEGSHCSGGSLD
ncbi:MAG: hypothetical protein WB676_23015 [Bryobacteraceae bacterium]